MINRRRKRWTSILAVACAACGAKGPASAAQPIAEFAALTDSVEIAVLQDAFLRGVIRFRYVNRTRHLVGVGSCHGTHPPTLETLANGQWKRTYEPIVLLCDGPPVLIPAGKTHYDSLQIAGCLRRCGPSWESDNEKSQARLVWQLYRLLKPVRYSSELRSGEPFQVVSELFHVALVRE
jgi:hypothetical protein